MNPYQILGIRRNASAATITKAYRARCKAAHPDAGGTQEAFEALKTARDVLLDPERRRVFDETGRIDPVVPDNTVEAAMGLISQALAQVLSNDQDPFRIDVVASLVMSFDKACDEITTRLAKLKRSRDRAAKMEGRFASAKGDNALERMLSWHADQIATAIRQTESALIHHRKAAEILKDYEFRKDPEPAHQAFIQFGSAFTSSTTTGW